MNGTQAPKYVLWNNYFACNMCNEPNAEPFPWCDHVRQAVKEGFDAGFLRPGMTINVPITPELNIWVEVHIDATEIAPGIARMEMLYKPEFANLKRIDIGLWNQGEGLWVMRTCIIDYIKSRLDPQEQIIALGPIVTACPSTSTHNLQARRWMATTAAASLDAKWECLWNMVMEGACTYCMRLSANPDNGGLGTRPLNSPPWNPIQATRDRCMHRVITADGSHQPCAYPQGHGGPHRGA
jgi:hypothetical protein